jgi:hypothetical protein
MRCNKTIAAIGIHRLLKTPQSDRKNRQMQLFPLPNPLNIRNLGELMRHVKSLALSAITLALLSAGLVAPAQISVNIE